MPTVLLIRHGESQSNAGLPTKCTEFVELTEKGYIQANEVSNYIRDASLYPDLIVTSHYIRTQQMAVPLRFFTSKVASKVRYFMSQKGLLKPSEEEWDVQEFTYLSTWHNIPSTLADRRGAVNRYWKNADPICQDSPKAESFEQFIKRVRAFKTRLESTEHDVIAIFSHEQFITAFLWLLEHGEVTPTSAEMRDYRKYLLNNALPNGAIVRAKFRQGYGEWTFERITEHLSDLNGWTRPVSVEESLFEARIEEKEPKQTLELATALSAPYSLSSD